jgi:pyruvate dehydrogenase E2 component (dihydrolipoyllysine-residue acetyltransferase)
MATRIDMPQLGLTMEKGTILQWLKAEGQAVEKGQPVVLIQTEKVEYEVESPAAGTLLKVVAAEGAEIPVGGLMAVLGQPGEDVSSFTEPRGESREARAASPEPRAASAAGQVPSAQPPTPAPAPMRAAGERVKISPAAKKLAQEHGIDIAGLTPTGPEGRIVREDVERAMAARGAAPAAGRDVAAGETPDVIPLAGIRKVIFDRMGQSWREAARVTLFAEADMTEVVTLRQAKGSDWEQRLGVKPSYSDLIHLAVARALREEPRINCRLEGQAVRIRREVHLSFAVDLGEGLVAAVIKDADKKSLGELAKVSRDLAERARAGRLLPDEMSDGTFTVSNLGGVGVEAFTPIINPPQAGILGIGKILEKPVVRNGGIHIRAMMMLSLVFDHRLIDGAPAGRFLAKVKDHLENPAWIQ